MNHFQCFRVSRMYQYIHCLSRPKFALPEHSHDFNHLIYVTEGELRVQTDGSEFVIGAGCVHIQPAGVPHMLSSESGYTQLGINFYPDERLRSTFPRPMTFGLPDMMANARQFFRLDRNSPYFTEQLIAYCDLIVYTAAAAAGRRAENPLKQRILDAIEANLAGEFTLASMAEVLYISPSHLERSCKSFFGMGMLALRNHKRFERACAMLMDGTLSVRDVGEALGFSEPSNFSAFFRRYAGFSPAQYRRRFFE